MGQALTRLNSWRARDDYLRDELRAKEAEIRELRREINRKEERIREERDATVSDMTWFDAILI